MDERKGDVVVAGSEGGGVGTKAGIVAVPAIILVGIFKTCFASKSGVALVVERRQQRFQTTT